MATSSSTTFAEARRQTWLARLAALAVLLALAVALYLAATYHTTVLKKEAPVSMLMPVEAPPPPPPPPKEIKPQDANVPLDRPLTPTQQTPKDNAITQNAETQEGSDAFGIGAGSGEGTHGSGIPGGFNRGAYASYLAGVIRQAVQGSTLHNKAFKVAISLWLSPAGKITRAQLRSSTGLDSDDQALEFLLTSLPPLSQLPPQSVLDTQPVQMTIDLRKPL